MRSYRAVICALSPGIELSAAGHDGEEAIVLALGALQERIELLRQRLELRLAELAALVLQEIGKQEVDDVLLDRDRRDLVLVDPRVASERDTRISYSTAMCGSHATANSFTIAEGSAPASDRLASVA